MYSNILVPMALDHDISPKTLQIARTLCAPGGKVTALHVHEAISGTVRTYLDDDIIRQGQESSRARLMAKLEGVEDVTPVLVVGHTYRSIIDYAVAEGVDCIVMGSAKPGLTDFLLGSTAARVVRHAPCSVHVHRAG